MLVGRKLGLSLILQKSSAKELDADRTRLGGKKKRRDKKLKLMQQQRKLQTLKHFKLLILRKNTQRNL